MIFNSEMLYFLFTARKCIRGPPLDHSSSFLVISRHFSSFLVGRGETRRDEDGSRGGPFNQKVFKIVPIGPFTPFLTICARFRAVPTGRL